MAHFFKGLNKFKIRKHAIVEGAIALVMFALILMAVNVTGRKLR